MEVELEVVLAGVVLVEPGPAGRPHRTGTSAPGHRYLVGFLLPIMEEAALDYLYMHWGKLLLEFSHEG